MYRKKTECMRGSVVSGFPASAGVLGACPLWTGGACWTKSPWSQVRDVALWIRVRLLLTFSLSFRRRSAASHFWSIVCFPATVDLSNWNHRNWTSVPCVPPTVFRPCPSNDSEKQTVQVHSLPTALWPSRAEKGGGGPFHYDLSVCRWS